MTIIHPRVVFAENFFVNNPNPPARQIFLTVANPGVNYRLVRTRVDIEMRVWCYSDSDSQNPPDNWYKNLFPVIGVLYQAAPFVPVSVIDPIGGATNLEWVIWGKLQGEMDEVWTSAGGHRRYVRRWRWPGGIAESFAQRSPGLMATQSLWLCWNWNDPSVLIDRQPGSFDVLYNLEVEAAVDSFWKPLP